MCPKSKVLLSMTPNSYRYFQWSLRVICPIFVTIVYSSTKELHEDYLWWVKLGFSSFHTPIWPNDYLPNDSSSNFIPGIKEDDFLPRLLMFLWNTLECRQRYLMRCSRKVVRRSFMRSVFVSRNTILMKRDIFCVLKCFHYSMCLFVLSPTRKLKIISQEN